MGKMYIIIFPLPAAGLSVLGWLRCMSQDAKNWLTPERMGRMNQPLL